MNMKKIIYEMKVIINNFHIQILLKIQLWEQMKDRLKLLYHIYIYIKIVYSHKLSCSTPSP